LGAEWWLVETESPGDIADWKSNDYVNECMLFMPYEIRNNEILIKWDQFINETSGVVISDICVYSFYEKEGSQIGWEKPQSLETVGIDAFGHFVPICIELLYKVYIII